MLICPYCENIKRENERGCCGESSAHFQHVCESEFCHEMVTDVYPDPRNNGKLVCFSCKYEISEKQTAKREESLCH